MGVGDVAVLVGEVGGCGRAEADAAGGVVDTLACGWWWLICSCISCSAHPRTYVNVEQKNHQNQCVMSLLLENTSTANSPTQHYLRLSADM